MNSERLTIVPADAPHHGPRFDWTINLGHILTFFGFIASGIVLYTTLDKRIQRIEDMSPFVQSSRDEKDARFQNALTSLSADLKDVKTTVDKLNMRMEVQSAVSDNRKVQK